MIQVNKARIQPIASFGKTCIDVLRLDLIHPLISGNKWFKLHNYLSEAKSLQKNKILTWGGAWSNHIIACAAACRELGFACTLLVRGERPREMSNTLEQALALGAEILFISRVEYQGKKIPAFLDPGDFYCIPEGGFGEPGAAGAAGLADLCEFNSYSHVLCAAGTGTMAAGLLRRVRSEQELIVIPVLKGFSPLENNIRSLAGLSAGRLRVIHDYHFGGYARRTGELIRFMNGFYERNGIPSDFVYTGKLFFGLQDLLQKDFFPPGSRLLAIHSGGLQGNESLDKGTLIF